MEDYHIVKYSELQKARSSKHRPFPAKNKYLEISVLGYKAPGRETIQSAIAEVVDGMLYPPAKLLGLSGIDKCSKEIKKWEKFKDDKLTRAAITNYFQISKDGGTGGGIFRKMYGEFLIEAAAIVDSTEMENIGHEYIMLGERWDEVAETMWQLSQKRNRELLKDISDMVGENYGIEKDLLMRLEKENKKSVDI